MNLSQVSHLARVICLPVPATQELMDQARSQRLVEATGTLHATSGNEMGYQLTDGGKSRALDALSQSEYYGAMPVPLAAVVDQQLNVLMAQGWGADDTASLLRVLELL